MPKKANDEKRELARKKLEELIARVRANQPKVEEPQEEDEEEEVDLESPKKAPHPKTTPKIVESLAEPKILGFHPSEPANDSKTIESLAGAKDHRLQPIEPHVKLAERKFIDQVSEELRAIKLRLEENERSLQEKEKSSQEEKKLKMAQKEEKKKKKEEEAEQLKLLLADYQERKERMANCVNLLNHKTMQLSNAVRF